MRKLADEQLSEAAKNLIPNLPRLIERRKDSINPICFEFCTYEYPATEDIIIHLTQHLVKSITNHNPDATCYVIQDSEDMWPKLYYDPYRLSQSPSLVISWTLEVR
jgi:hypothetical protein